jgi:methionyl-tRNA synthetase
VSDLVKRLRDNQPCCGVFKCDHCLEAAARIEELERDIELLKRKLVERETEAHWWSRREALEEALRLVRGYPAVSTAPPGATDIVVREIAVAIRALVEKKDG